MVGGMDPVAVAERVHRIVAVLDDAAPSDDLIESGLVAVREVQAWADAQQGLLVAKLSADGFAEARIAKASKTSLGAAEKATQRSKTLAATPKLAGALGDGATTAAHIDVVTRAAAQLPVAQRVEVVDASRHAGGGRCSVDTGTVRPSRGHRSQTHPGRRRHRSSRTSTTQRPSIDVGRRRRDVEPTWPVRPGHRGAPRRET